MNPISHSLDNGYPWIKTAGDVAQFQDELRSAKGKKDYLSVVMRWSYNDPDIFNTMVLGRGQYWSKQREMCRNVASHTTTLVLSGNQIGKSYFLSGILLWYLFTRPYSRVVSTAPTANHLSRVLWTEVKNAHANAFYPLGGKITSSPSELLALDDKWDAIGLTSPKKEALSGIHGRHVLVCIDEASGMSPDAWEGLNSLGYDKLVAVGNPVRTDNHFFNLCNKAGSADSRIKLMTISSMMSPHIDQWKSDWGLACGSWLEDMREQYGEGSSWWRSHVLAMWPEQSTESLFRKDWLDLAEKATYTPSGHKRMGIDVAEGGRDEAVICVGDDNGLLHLEGSNKWDFDGLADRCRVVAKQFEVDPTRITWDASGTGSAFGHFLTGRGLGGCRPYKGSFGAAKSTPGINLRTNAAWRCSRRLDPARTVVVEVPETGTQTIGRIFSGRNPTEPRKERVKQTPYSIPPRFMAKLRSELESLRYEETSNGKLALESGEDFRDRLGRSPNSSDAWFQLWCGF